MKLVKLARNRLICGRWAAKIFRKILVQKMLFAEGTMNRGYKPCFRNGDKWPISRNASKFRMMAIGITSIATSQIGINLF